MTLYRFPSDKLHSFNVERGELPSPTVENVKEFPEETIFSLVDLVDLYKKYALQDERIKDFVEKLKDIVEQ